MKIFLFSWSISDRNNVASSADRDLGITPILLSSIPASDASHQIAQETDARFGHGGRMCKRLLSTVAPLTARSKSNERGAGFELPRLDPLMSTEVNWRNIAVMLIEVLSAI